MATTNWSREEAKSLVKRFGSFATPPSEPEALGVTIDTLWRACETRQHAEKVVQDIIESPGEPVRWPSPERINAVAHLHKPRALKCQHCDGAGWRSAPFVSKGIEYSNSVRCVCNGGRLPAPTDGKAAAAGKEEEVVW